MDILILPLIALALLAQGHMGHIREGAGCAGKTIAQWNVHGQRARCIGSHESVQFCDSYCPGRR